MSRTPDPVPERRFVSIDPGSVHCGWASWTCGTDGLWECDSAIELTKHACEDRLFTLFNVHGLAIEGFWLRPDLAVQQTGSSFGEVEVIGVARAVARRNNLKFHVVTPVDRDATLARLKARGYKFEARGHGGHAQDAEAVLVAALKLSVRAIRTLVNPR